MSSALKNGVLKRNANLIGYFDAKHEMFCVQLGFLETVYVFGSFLER